MRSAQSFRKLLRTGRKRLRRLRGHATWALDGRRSSSERDRRLSYVVIESQNLWANFVRAYLLSCLTSPRWRNGGVITLGNAAVQLPGDVLHLGARAARGPHAAAPTSRREEPRWWETGVFLKTCQDMQCSHFPDVQAALSAQTRALYDMPTFRNFYAHRNDETAERAVRLARRQYLIAGVRHPTAALATPALNRPQALVLDWLDEIGVLMELLCE